MKYYSDVTRKLYDTVEELSKAEAAVARAEQERKAEAEKKKAELAKKQAEQTKLKEQRAARAQEITEAIKVRDEAQKKVNELVNNFVKDYGSYHYTWSSDFIGDTFKTMVKFF